ncbi:permease prefix domain 1-containing protein [Streptomyces sp. NPDC004732]|uniref:permease prefix domain 1-containing protein n=1 Tax=Streptomyces sp. NPDC004732 TaxID=3154290 RepID=UPI0033B9C268
MSVAAPRDPVEEHVARLSATLLGPPRAKSRLLEEMRDGLLGTAEALVESGVPEAEAARLAVRDFGTVEELAPACQHELTIAQARHTARTLTLTVPFLLACWYLARGDLLWQQLAAHLALIATLAALLAAATLAATGALARRLPTPHRLPLTVAWVGTTASAAMAVAALSLTVAAVLATNWLLLAAAGVLAAASHAVVATSVRACRRCVGLSPAQPAAG